MDWGGTGSRRTFREFEQSSVSASETLPETSETGGPQVWVSLGEGKSPSTRITTGEYSCYSSVLPCSEDSSPKFVVPKAETQGGGNLESETPFLRRYETPTGHPFGYTGPWSRTGIVYIPEPSSRRGVVSSETTLVSGSVVRVVSDTVWDPVSVGRLGRSIRTTSLGHSTTYKNQGSTI